MPNNHFETDIAIIGGGIAGLLLQNRLNNLGYSTLLVEHQTLGSDQSSKAQGIIHGGVKYALLGQISEAATAIADQPNIWKSYLTNTNINSSLSNKPYKLNLSKTKILATHHDLWNNGDLKNKLKQMLMQKTLSSQGGAINKTDPEYPEIFKNKDFHGSVYKINETVIDMFSLLENLALNTQDQIIKIDTDSLDISLDINKINFIKVNQDNKEYTIKAEQYIFTAGQQNQNIINLLPDLPKMQLRPLHMVLAKFPEPHILYGHYIGASLLPELTITTHYTKDQQYIWYLGGKIAEDGVNLSQAQQIAKAQTEINNIFPWLTDTKHWRWASFMVNRAEPLQANNKKPDHAFFAHTNNTIVGWPVKMALAPMLADKIINYLDQINFKPIHKKINIKNYNLKTANIAQPIWEELFK